jgi:Protein of unknown function (DUF2971)
MKPWEYPPPPILFKYLPPERLHVLTDCRVRFSQRAAFEDDHELQPDYAIFGTSDEIWRFAISTGAQLSRGGLPAGVIVRALATDPRQQKLAIENMQRHTTVKDELGCFCLTEFADSGRMWTEYAGNEKGFVLGFDTAHRGFIQQLIPRGRLGKMSYSDEPFGSALGAVEDEGAGVMFRKRMRYAFEREWRIVRLLKGLEQSSTTGHLSISPEETCHAGGRPRPYPLQHASGALEVSSHFQHLFSQTMIHGRADFSFARPQAGSWPALASHHQSWGELLADERPSIPEVLGRVDKAISVRHFGV